MSTRSAIGYVDNKNVIRAVYCHFDGYPEGVGKVLYNFYNYNEMKELVSLGDLSQLGKYIGEKHNFNNCPEDTCNFYGRDREEDDVSSKKFYTLREFIEHYEGMWCEYFYILDNHVWFVCHDGNTKQLKEFM